eukprot:4885898-Alexandrium_andersonii.AAC.1
MLQIQGGGRGGGPSRSWPIRNPLYRPAGGSGGRRCTAEATQHPQPPGSAIGVQVEEADEAAGTWGGEAA